MLTKSATLMPAADLPPSEARGRYHGGLLTKSATLMPAADLPPSRARGRYHGWLADEVSNSNASRRPAAEQSEGALPWRLAHEVEGHRHTPEKKKQDLTCAEPSQTPSPKLQDEIFCKSVNLTQNYLLYK